MKMKLFDVIQRCSFEDFIKIFNALSDTIAMEYLYCKSCKAKFGYENAPCYSTGNCPFNNDDVLKWALEQDWRKIYEEQFKVNSDVR